MNAKRSWPLAALVIISIITTLGGIAMAMEQPVFTKLQQALIFIDDSLGRNDCDALFRATQEFKDTSGSGAGGEYPRNYFEALLELHRTATFRERFGKLEFPADKTVFLLGGHEYGGHVNVEFIARRKGWIFGPKVWRLRRIFVCR